MNCPKCNNEAIELSIEHREGFIEAEIFCPKCEEVVGFHWIKDEDWITDLNGLTNRKQA